MAASVVMLQSSDVTSLLRHMEWADALTWKSLLDLPAALQDGRLRDLLYHLHSVQWAYLQIWRGEPVRIPELSELPELSGVHAWARAYYRELPAFLERLRDAELAAPVRFPWAEQLVARFGTAGPTNVGESIIQVSMHTAYHRGQVATRTRELSGEPPLVDFIVWLWMGRPAPRWDGNEAG